MKKFPEADFQYPKKLHELYNHFSFLPERMKIEKSKSLQLTYIVKWNTL